MARDLTACVNAQCTNALSLIVLRKYICRRASCRLTEIIMCELITINKKHTYVNKKKIKFATRFSKDIRQF